MTGPRNGPCSPWCTQAQIEALPAVVTAIAKALAAGTGQPAIDAICATAATAASEVLYELSGRVYTGACGPVTVRPVSRPTDADTRSVAGGSALGWFSAFGSASSYGFASPGVVAHYATEDPPTIRLPYPVTAIAQVKIDGTVIPSDEYELRGHQELVRLRVSASASPTARWGWPTSQIPDLPDTEPGTFSVTFTYGNAPPQMGVLAAVKLGEYLALPQLGNSTHYPKNTRQMTRQGVTTQVAATIDIQEKGSLGIWEVDAFILAVNPKRLPRQSAVWSPDVGRARRTANPSS